MVGELGTRDRGQRPRRGLRLIATPRVAAGQHTEREQQRKGDRAHAPVVPDRVRPLSAPTQGVEGRYSVAAAAKPDGGRCSSLADTIRSTSPYSTASSAP